MIILTHEDILKLDIKPLDCYAWVKRMIAEKERAVLKPKISLKFGEYGFYNTMPCLLPDINTAGVKVVNRYENRIPSLDAQLMLYDLENGCLKAIMDANFITTMRTGAVAAYTVEMLAKKDFYEVGFIGLGNTARATFKVLSELYKGRKLKIKLKAYKNQHNEFIELYQKDNPDMCFEVCENDVEVIGNSDVIISSVTYADHNLAPDSAYKEGCLVVPIHTRGFQNCDLFFDKVYADDRGHVEGFKYFDRFREFAELSDVVAGRKSGRESSTQRILAYNIGISVHDIFFASQIYQRAKDLKRDIGSLNNISEKSWLK